MALQRRFTLRPDQRAAIKETREAKQAAIPVEETLAIEITTPEPEPEPVKPEPVEETTAEVKPIPEKVTEDPVPEETKPEEIKEEPEEVKEEPEETKKEPEETEKEPESVPEEEPATEPKKPKRTRKTSKKAETAEKPAEEPEIINVTTSLGKNQELTDALAVVVPPYTDTAFEEFKEQMEADLLRTAFDEQADTAVIKVILSNLSRCYDNAAKEYAKVNMHLERLANKTYGLIPRQIIANSNGLNEAARKQNGIHAPEIYTAPNGETMNLYALQAALEAEVIYLQMVMKKLEYKRSTLISFLTANKLEAGITGD